MAEVLLDTDVFIDHIRGFRRLPPSPRGLCHSVVTRAELFSGSQGADAIPALLAPLREFPVDRAIAERAGRIRRATGVRLPDALIAATALGHDLPLSTRNRRDFDRVAGLRLVPPEDLANLLASAE